MTRLTYAQRWALVGAILIGLSTGTWQGFLIVLGVGAVVTALSSAKPVDRDY